jgi:hypothetical protein
VWRGTINEPGARVYREYFAFFNLDDKPVALRTTWEQLGLDGKKHGSENVWTEVDGKESKEIGMTLPAHGSALYVIR